MKLEDSFFRHIISNNPQQVDIVMKVIITHGDKLSNPKRVEKT